LGLLWRGVFWGGLTDAKGFVNLPAYETWSDWRVTDWVQSPQPEGRIRVVATTNNLILRQYSTKTITGLGASTVGPGGTLRVNGSNLDQAGASWLGRVKLVPESENSSSPGPGVSLPVLAQSNNFMDVGIPGYVPSGRYKIRMDNNPAYLYSAGFNVAGSALVTVAKIDSDQISYTSTNLVAGYGINTYLILSNLVSSNSFSTGTYFLQNSAVIGPNTAIAKRPEGMPAGSYGVWLQISGLRTNWESSLLGPFGNINF